MDVAAQFAQQGYVFLDGLVDAVSCKELTLELQRLAAVGKTEKDRQCPLSQAIYGDATFDNMLNTLKPSLELATGKRLIPTYSYARLYAPGEELENHRDREACEISATVTLGFSGAVWPIYIGDSEDKADGTQLNMSVGDAMVYRGCDKWHWREKYTEGQWQAQVFLHYVDADGPYSAWAFDKRGTLTAAPKATSSLRYWTYDDIFTDQACELIIKAYDNAEKLPPVIGEGAGNVNRDIRNVERVMLPVYKDLGGRLAAAGFAANNRAWKFAITHANQAEFLKYPAGGRYTAHIDTFISREEPECRKLTVLVFLNDDFDGGRFFLLDGHEKHYPPQKKGTVLVFPSFTLHGVEDVISGTRYSAVCWLAGPFFN